jgi:hypothetical protein
LFVGDVLHLVRVLLQIHQIGALERGQILQQDGHDVGGLKNQKSSSKIIKNHQKSSSKIIIKNHQKSSKIIKNHQSHRRVRSCSSFVCYTSNKYNKRTGSDQFNRQSEFCLFMVLEVTNTTCTRLTWGTSNGPAFLTTFNIKCMLRALILEQLSMHPLFKKNGRTMARVALAFVWEVMVGSDMRTVN